MTPTHITALFISTVALSGAIRLWLLVRHYNHVGRHRKAVPEAFASRVDLPAHKKAADYSRDKTRLAGVAIAADAAFVLTMTLGGVIDVICRVVQPMSSSSLLQGLLLFSSYAVLSTLYSLPIDIYQTFVIEQKHGFNKQTWQSWLLDGAKGTVLSISIGAPILLGVLWFMDRFSETWWLYAWTLWMTFNLLLLWIYPTWIAPLFNKFTELSDPALAARLEVLLRRCGFRASGLFVMDGSRRTSHGNAYFTGFGASKRIVLFDTLLQMLSHSQIEAVLAHELGHSKHHHVLTRLATASLISLLTLALIALLLNTPAFFSGLGVSQPGTASGLLLALIWLPALSLPLTPLLAWVSRRNEFEADQYAAEHTSAADLIDALVALYRENAATLTPDPLHSLFFDSHPPAVVRIGKLETMSRPQKT